jgi:hypothetical protein
MGDLISKKEVLDFIKKELKQDRPDDFKIRNIQRFIEDLPCAYNVEKVVEEMNKLLNEELHNVLKPLPDGTEYPEEAYRLLYLNTRLRGLIRNGGKE